MKKMIACDYDNTFFVDAQDIERNKEAVARFVKAGGIFVIATGRSYYDLHTMMDRFGFTYDYAVINHGATAIDKDDNVIANFTIDDKAKNDLLNDYDLPHIVKCYACDVEHSRACFTDNDLTKLNATYDTVEKAKERNAFFNEKYGKFVNSYIVDGAMIEIISSATDKANGVRAVAKKVGMDEKDIYAIGDSYSDVEMVSAFNGYCMTNSVEPLKEVAKGEYVSVSDFIDDIMNGRI